MSLLGVGVNKRARVKRFGRSNAPWRDVSRLTMPNVEHARRVRLVNR